MLIIINDDHFYLSWLAHHRLGYVLDSYRRPAKRHLVWHRATCSAIKGAKRAHWTTGTHIKVCSPNPVELAQWARDETGGDLQPCPHCRPDQELRAEDLADNVNTTAEHAHRTVLGGRIMDHVLELAAMRLGGELPKYQVTVGDVAEAFSKSLAQISPALVRLAEEGQIKLTGRISPGAPLGEKVGVFPAAAALRSLPAFAELTDEALDAEIGELHMS
jgi:hypothetical protein